jgi:hypothetical protein
MQLSIYSMGFLRSYNGHWKDRVTQKNTERIFYNEREWRALKPSDKHDFLSFEFNDINHIIMLTDEERKTVISMIKEKFNTAKQQDIGKKIFLHEEITSEIMEKM